ncbi:acetyl-CoA carboxylase biotin carboxyl carrier protein [Nocardia sienata]|uniref:acetyl-CoA carboxylase biotin carboxyl carrier protein n=1 Tax=Nocardia sienata TaxID=248552 RepID=UPI0007A38AC8|nr:acetyl-CoA carboxylase biotin carboxyl carrier protein [Nocardia sienata]
MDFDLEELAAIIEQLDKTEFTEFRFEKGDLNLLVRRGTPAEGGGAPEFASTTPLEATTPNSARPTAPLDAPATLAAEPAAPAPASSSDEIVVTAPMLGTFYRSPKPGERPFVEVGDKVELDSVLGIIEVMKLMNSVPAGAEGEVTAIYATDGDLVEFDQPLFAIRPIA